MAALLLCPLLACSVSQEAYGTGAFVHMWWCKLPRTMCGHPYQVMDPAMPGVSNIVQVSSTASQWSYDVYAGWDANADDSVCTFTAMDPGNRYIVYVHVVLLLEENRLFSFRFDSIVFDSIRFDSISLSRRFDRIRFGSIRFDLILLDSSRFDSILFAWARRFDWIRCYSIRLDSILLDSIRSDPI